MYLADLTPVELASVSYGTAPAKADSVSWEHPITERIQYCDSNKTVFLSYDLNRKWRRFVTDVALDDQSHQSSTMRVRVDADGQTVFPQTAIGVGQSQHIDIDISNVLRLNLSIAYLVPNGGYCNPVVWGDPLLQR
ncbi:MAG: NPCBM/NEW2 domain-containing protein [Actinomycetota bacterium]|nr:NPCBM/NEW2 domain-containing protein [Actinomycetota bacterium]MDQ6945676.1 NPCBM/NEW2 domain-containing protein [Actinomycetota bacterium]